MPLIKITKGVARGQGARPYQEDQYALADEAFSQSGFALYSVFDGHGGGEASKHASKHLPKLVVNSDAFKQGDYKRALKEAFLEEDRQLAQEFKVAAAAAGQAPAAPVGAGGLGAGNGTGRGGSTATVALIAHEKLYVANVGDSTAALAKRVERGQGGANAAIAAGDNGVGTEVAPATNGEYVAVRLSKEHKVDDKAESDRLQKADATVRADRVVGPGHAINMTRALGDFDFKLPENGAKEDWISPVPHLTEMPLTPAVDFAIIASDGLWNHFHESQLIPMVADMRKQGSTPQQICDSFVSKLEQTPGSDNITFMLLDFTWSEQ
ncbi:phosphatase 2C-like domain-containing protein [Fimicolochytrium jonesii]|uniref:phosphatase 2C-like domain-containing protein n=1 Tax=Fimicolochytrium jonesii TaxID=1396493 RepID=UPI0022FE237E|nr:phosphatase 2C-like domain-containing protein [Fimicolochytrium jonesii]KAI8823051.1 phosphatase 2C-like domain-containing protein [Fimicolochytrium jonesii]